MGPEKAAYRGGCPSLPEPPEGAIRHEERYHDHPASPARRDSRPADRDCAGRGAAHADGGAEGRGGALCRAAQRGASARRPPTCRAPRGRAGADDPDRARPGQTGPDRARPGQTGPDRARPGQTGIGAIPVRRQKVRDRATDAAPEAKIRFTSNTLPKWARRTRSLDALLPVLYLRGVSTGDFQEALTALLGARTRRTCRRA